MKEKARWEDYMSLILTIVVIVAFFVFCGSISSCSTPKQMKDCRGIKHTKQSGGFYL